MDEHILIRAGIGEMDEESSHRAFDLCADLEEFEPDGATRGLGHTGAFEGDATHGAYEYVRDRGEP